MNRILGLMLLLLLPVTGWTNGRKGSKPVEIIILHTNDMHAKIDNFPKLAYLEDSLSRLHRFVFLVASGDNFTGNPVVDLVSDKGYPMIDLMNRCGFDASALGNHEFDLGQEMLNRRMKQARFPFISCNLDATGAVLHQPAPYAVLKAGRGIRIALLGVLELNEKGIPDTHPSRVEGIRFTDGITTAQNYRGLKGQYGILIGVTHLGVWADSLLALAMPELDLILGGHSHTLLKTPLSVNGVMITQAGSGLAYVGKTTLMVQDGRVISRKDEIISLTALKGADKKIRKRVNRYNDVAEFRKVAGVTETPLQGYGELGSMMTDALTSGLDADVAFLNRGGIRISSLPAGDITLKDVYRLDPFGNLAVSYRMTEAEIKTLISRATEKAGGIDLEASGLRYTATLDQNGKCTKVELTAPDGTPFEPGKVFTVVVNSYIAASYDFDHADPGKTLKITTAQLLIDFLKKQEKVSYSGVERATLARP